MSKFNLKILATMFALLISCVSSFATTNASAATTTADLDHVLTFTGFKVAAHVHFVNVPKVDVDSPMTVQIVDANGAPVNFNGKIKVNLVMPEMPDMTNAPTHTVQATDAQGAAIVGLYNVNNVFFSMDGHWQIQFVLKASNGKGEVQSFDINL